ncbi:MAG: hypothetical protein IT377_18835 [Polyangiaceae bacterium]|nr:hypothetical protein [Polyangiaceae bacterium]
MKGRSLALVVLWGAAAGCMVHERKVESTPGAVSEKRSPPLSGSERIYALVLPRRDLLELSVRSESLCVIRQLRRVRREEVLERRPAPARFVGAVAAVVGGSILIGGDGSDELGGSLVAAGAAIAVVPMLLRGADRRALPDLEQAEPGARSIPCGDRPLRAPRVAVRAGSQTFEARADVAGRVRFRDVAQRSELVVFVNDVAVPVSVADPIKGTSPPAEAPVRPDDPDTR